MVADATLTMFKTFCAERLAAGIMALTSVLLLIAPGSLSQIAALILAAGIGMAFHNSEAAAAAGQGKIAVFPLALFIILFAGLPVLAFSSAWFDLAASFYRAGSLVFGGGHVVLPLLQQSVGEAVGADRFLTGYAAAQAVPGPMFSLAAFLGAELSADPTAGRRLAGDPGNLPAGLSAGARFAGRLGIAGDKTRDRGRGLGDQRGRGGFIAGRAVSARVQQRRSFTD